MRSINPKDISKYDKYDLAMKVSVCHAAFSMYEGQMFPPHKGMFYFARVIGYEIPEKWRDMHLDMIP